jgi:hypothetical protein
MDRSRPPAAGPPARRAGTRAAAAVAALAAVLAGCSAAPPAPAPVPAPSAASTAPPATPLPSATATAVAPGRGSVADRAAVETVLRTYLSAVAARDFPTACALNAPETTQRLLDELARRGTTAATCEDAMRALYAEPGVADGAAQIARTVAVRTVDVDGDAATVVWSVEVAGRHPEVTNALRRVDGRWRLLPTPDPAGRPPG